MTARWQKRTKKNKYYTKLKTYFKATASLLIYIFYLI